MAQILLMLFAVNNYKGERNTETLFGSFVVLSTNLKTRVKVTTKQ